MAYHAHTNNYNLLCAKNTHTCQSLLSGKAFLTKVGQEIFLIFTGLAENWIQLLLLTAFKTLNLCGVNVRSHNRFVIWHHILK